MSAFPPLSSFPLLFDRFNIHSLCSGKLGLGNIKDEHVVNPTRVGHIDGVITSIACGGNHSIVVTNLGVYSWGDGAQGQLGLSKSVLVLRAHLSRSVQALRVHNPGTPCSLSRYSVFIVQGLRAHNYSVSKLIILHPHP